MSFWISAIVVAALVGGLLALAIGRTRGRVVETGGHDVQVYRDQLSEVERDVARGVISAEEAERARIEVSRRLLEADRNAEGAAAVQGGGNWMAAGVLGVAVLGLAFLIYGQLGAPNYPDLPLKERIAQADEARANRPAQAEIEAQVPAQINPASDPRMVELLEQLRAALESRPNDLQGHVLLTRNEAARGDFVAAYKAQERVVAIRGEEASAGDYADLADLMILAAGGYVSPEAETALARALQRDPGNGTALYYSGLMFAQSGRADMAFRLWSDLLADSDPDAPWVDPIRQQIELVAQDAGVRYTLPPLAGTKGPTSADIEAAGDMSAADRGDMIRNMVEGLSARLADEGGTPEEWAQLIGALGVLGESDRARAIWGEAQVVFGGNPAALATVQEAASRAGVVN